MPCAILEALKNGKLRARKRRGGNRIGYLVWHYTTDQDRAVQHLPTNEQGEHADFDGPGNRYSIGIEMCENRGNSRSATIERTAKLAAYLMHKHDIPLRKIVPHYHWPRRGLSQPHKNCPHYLLDNGHPGAKWQWFLAKVDKHYKSISSGSPGVVPRPGTPSSPSINRHGMIVCFLSSSFSSCTSPFRSRKRSRKRRQRVPAPAPATIPSKKAILSTAFLAATAHRCRRFSAPMVCAVVPLPSAKGCGFPLPRASWH